MITSLKQPSKYICEISASSGIIDSIIDLASNSGFTMLGSGLILIFRLTFLAILPTNPSPPPNFSGTGVTIAMLPASKSTLYSIDFGTIFAISSFNSLNVRRIFSPHTFRSLTTHVYYTMQRTAGIKKSRK